MKISIHDRYALNLNENSDELRAATAEQHFEIFMQFFLKSRPTNGRKVEFLLVS